MAQENLSSLTVELSPKEMGKVRIELSVNDNRVETQIVVESQSVQTLVNQVMPDLKTALEQQGMTLGGFDVRLSHDSERQEADTRDGKQTGSDGTVSDLDADGTAEPRLWGYNTMEFIA